MRSSTMVSIPDWSRFTRSGMNSLGSAGRHANKYSKQREYEIIKQAEDQGYFLSLTKTLIGDMFTQDDHDDANNTRRSLLDDEHPLKDLSKVKLIALTNAHLRSLGDIGLCTHLRICVLSNNYISRIDALAVCHHLIKLDVSSNQITLLPGSDFWARLENLRILHLHDNPIGRIESLTYLSSALQLAVITLYDTPLCLKRNYRHHVANSIWSLKALDKHVVSDEEIIEDAEFSGYFSLTHPAFQANLYPKLPQNSTYEQQIDSVNRVFSTVNRILAHHSPVLMIQKFIRGHLIRKQFKFVGDTRICKSVQPDRRKRAAVTIQRGFRGWKGIPGPKSGPPPTSPVFGGPATTNVDVIKMDFDTYLQNRRPGSTVQSEGSLPSRTSGPVDGRMGSADSITQKQRKNLFINLTKLQMGALHCLQDDAVAIETVFPTEASFGRDTSRDGRCPKKKRDSEVKSRRIKSVKQFFGPVVPTVHSPEPQLADNEELPIVNFRLRGLKKAIQVNDPTTDLIIARREAGRDTRAAEFDHHLKMDNEPKPKISKKTEASNLQRMLSKAQGTMGLSCLRAVQQAYKDRERMERQVQRMECVLSLRDQRENARDRIKVYHDAKRAHVLKERDADQKKILEEFDRKDTQIMTYLEKSGELRSKSSQHWRKRRGEISFTTDFNVQNTSVSNALMRHDRQAKQEDKLQERSDLVMAHKVIEKDQQDIVKKYMEHRQFMRQAEVAMSRAALDTKMLQEANDRLIVARNRVAQQKARTANIQAKLMFPTINTPSLPPGPQEAHSSTFLRTRSGSQLVQRSATVA